MCAVLFQVESSRKFSLQRVHLIWVQNDNTEPALPRFGKKHSRERAQQRQRLWDRNTHDVLRNRKRINVIRVWWVSGRYVQGGGKEPDHISRSCPSVLWSAPAQLLRDICALICPCCPSVTSHTLSSIIFLHINILFSQTSVKFSNS